MALCPSVSPTQVGHTDGQTDTDRPTFSLNPLLLRSDSALLTIVRIYKLYLLTYLRTYYGVLKVEYKVAVAESNNRVVAIILLPV